MELIECSAAPDPVRSNLWLSRLPRSDAEIDAMSPASSTPARIRSRRLAESSQPRQARIPPVDVMRMRLQSSQKFSVMGPMNPTSDHLDPGSRVSRIRQ